MCVILTAGHHIRVDQTMVDDEAILTTLSIIAMAGHRLEQWIKPYGGRSSGYIVARDLATRYSTVSIAILCIAMKPHFATTTN